VEPSAQLKAVPIGYKPVPSAPRQQLHRRPLRQVATNLDDDSPGRWRHAGSFLWMAWPRLSTEAGGRAREAVGNACTSIPT